jgi:hypothetical protein
VLEALAHFHGSWWQYLNAEGAFRYRSSSLAAREVDAFFGLGNLDAGVNRLRSAARVRPKEIAKILRESDEKDELERVSVRLDICDAVKRMNIHTKSANASQVSD